MVQTTLAVAKIWYLFDNAKYFSSHVRYSYKISCILYIKSNGECSKVDILYCYFSFTKLNHRIKKTDLVGISQIFKCNIYFLYHSLVQ